LAAISSAAQSSEAEAMIDLSALPIFPCNLAKEPLTAHGFKDARRGANTRGWPLVGFATGAVSGIDVLDLDPTGNDWYGQKLWALPQTRAHQTQRGLHLLFRHAPGLRCSTSRIAPGVDVKADGGYAIFWPRQGLAVKDLPLAEWPGWLLQLALEQKDEGSAKRDPDRFLSLAHGFGVHGYTEALFKLDPAGWNNKTEKTAKGYLRWLALMSACKAVGISADDFVAWCVQDPDYANDADEIRPKWEGLKPKHGGVLWATLSKAGIKLGREKKEPVEDPLPAGTSYSRQPTRSNWRFRLECTCNKFIREPSEPMLFWAACVFAEVMAQHHKPTPSIATKLLEDAAKQSGLWKQLGADEVRRTITNGLHHVEKQILAREEP
jgi:hypothetical protein